MQNGSPREKFFFAFGWLLIGMGLLFNQWVLTFFLPQGAIQVKIKYLILLFELAFIGLGFAIIKTRGKLTPEFLKNFYISTALITFNTLLLFLIVNLVIGYFDFRTAKKRVYNFYIEADEKMKTDKAFRHKVYGGYSDKDLCCLMHTPGNRQHPTLEMMSAPAASKFYNIGFENMRYTRFVNESNARSKIQGAVWVFGGSTTYGYGVADEETIPAYLNESDSSVAYINFAVQSAHQNIEIQKLLLLLKKGYRPAKVFFIDGLNDIGAMKASNFSPAETPARNSDAYSYLTNIDVLKKPPIEFVLRSLPLVDYVLSINDRMKMKEARYSVFSGYDDIYNEKAVYHQDPVSHYNLLAVAAEDYAGMCDHIKVYQEKLVSYYRMNDEFLQRIAKSFGFEYYVFLQPLGNLRIDNPFIKDPVGYVAIPAYKYYRRMMDTAKSAIRNGDFPHFIDISDTDAECPDCYVDMTHYSPALSKTIAKKIIALVKSREKGGF
ncbi:MAG: SGNH/GDSL hydrolase family protein [Chitinispirillaceae bacterium]|nr:SGNH/GDSL hydrolase family protein [Chitinispirillaceae bacterium]